MEEFFSIEEVRTHPSIDNVYVRTLTGKLPAGRWEHGPDGGAAQWSGGDDVWGEPLDESDLAQALRNMQRLDVCGVLEKFEQSAWQILKLFNADDADAHLEALQGERKMVLDRIMHQDPGLKPVKRQELTAKTRRSMEELVHYDMEIYQTAIKRFDDSLAPEYGQG